MQIELSDFQNKVCEIPEQFDVFFGGGRGGAKSFTMAILALRHCEMYKEKARVLYIRQTYRGLADFESLTRELFGQLYRNKASYNATEHVWRLPNGGYVELGQLESPRDYTKYQGRSFTLLLIDEAGQYATPELLDRLRSNLRGAKEMPIRIVTAANPGGVGHHWIAKRYVFKNAPWKPFEESNSGRKWVYAPSTVLDNPFIDQDEYRQQLEASCPTDPELLRAWIDGDWSVARGALFCLCD
jgi:phage terminase large subunit